MGWKYFLKRLLVIWVIFTIGALIIGPILLGGSWTITNIYLSLFAEGAILLIFGACLGTSRLEGVAFTRYAVNPPATRDTRRHSASRMREQQESSIVFIAAGAITLLTAFLLLTFYPLLPWT